MLRILNPSQVPPGGFYRYTDLETGKTYQHPYHSRVVAWAHNHRVVNNLPIPTNWEEFVEDRICACTPTCPCGLPDQAPPTVIQRATRFARAMTQWAASGFVLASEEVVAERRLICEGGEGHARCSQWHKGSGFFGFGRCGSCGCATGLKSAILEERCPLNKWPVIN